MEIGNLGRRGLREQPQDVGFALRQSALLQIIEI